MEYALIAKEIGKSEGSIRGMMHRLRKNPAYRPLRDAGGGRHIGTIQQPMPSPEVRSVVLTLEAHRIKVGLSMVEFCNRAGYHQSAWHRILMGKRLPSIRVLSDFAQAMGFGVQVTLTREGVC